MAARDFRLSTIGTKPRSPLTKTEVKTCEEGQGSSYHGVKGTIATLAESEQAMPPPPRRGITRPGRATPTGGFSIKVRFLGGLSTTQETVFSRAAERWQTLISGDLPNAQLPSGEIVDDVLIDASGVRIDGPFGILGQAGPTHLRANTLLPAKGIMEFDTADLTRMEEDGSLEDVIIHEMGHVLGIGTIWQDLGLLQGAGTANPTFLGDNAQREFGLLAGAGGPLPVPVANTGGPGTRDGHWRESVFGHELMTGFINPGSNPISRVTVAALKDLGYEVNLDAADEFTLPNSFEMALMGIGALEHPQGCCMCGTRTRGVGRTVLPE
jgi:hypothetical protein